MGRSKSEPPTGELPVRTTAQRIVAEKEAALVEAERKLAEARASYDEHGVIEAEARIRALRDILADLETRHAAELEELARDRARRWIEAQASGRIVREIEKRQQNVSDCIDAAVEAIRAEGQARQRWTEARAGIELLVARWPELATQVPAATATPPASSDYVGRVAEAGGDNRDTHRRPLLTVGAPASATPAERRRSLLRRLFEVLRRRGSSVPQDVRAIIEAAPRPSELDETDAERERRERREGQQAAAVEQFGQVVEETKRTLDAIPGSALGSL